MRLDVTDRADMQESFRHLIDMSGDGGMLAPHGRLVELDAEYDEVLEDAAETGEVVEYDQWLDGNSKDAATLAHELVDGFSKTVKQLGSEHGIDLDAAPEQAMR